MQYELWLWAGQKSWLSKAFHWIWHCSAGFQKKKERKANCKSSCFWWYTVLTEKVCRDYRLVPVTPAEHGELTAACFSYLNSWCQLIDVMRFDVLFVRSVQCHLFSLTQNHYHVLIYNKHYKKNKDVVSKNIYFQLVRIENGRANQNCTIQGTFSWS